MKYKLLFFIAFLSVFVACKSTNSPKAVTETFLVSVARLDITTAKNYSTPQTWGMLKVLQKETKGLSDEQKESFLDNFKVTILSDKKINDSLYTVEFSTQPELFPFTSLNLVAEKNLEGNIKWKVDFNSFEYYQSDSTIQEVMAPGADPEDESDGAERVLVDSAAVPE